MRRPARTCLVLLACCWLAAGPGGAAMQAIACPHHSVPQGAHGGHQHPLPSDAPCFCGEMTGGSDIALSAPALPAPPLIGTVIAAPVVVVAVPRLPTLASSFSPQPIPPPPDARA